MRNKLDIAVLNIKIRNFSVLILMTAQALVWFEAWSNFSGQMKITALIVSR